MKPISMMKSELALLYFPHSNPKAATRRLMRWINLCSQLVESLRTTGYRTSQKVFTSRQVTLIFEYLGAPSEEGDIR